jgi:hypothetical protein
MKKSTVLSTLILAVLGVGIANSVFANGRGDGPIIFVTSQGLYFDSIVVVDPLPQKGNFQQLIPSMNGLETEYGPGTPGHLGGRWWVDVNDDNQMDAGDHYFLCPLLGPGRKNP